MGLLLRFPHLHRASTGSAGRFVCRRASSSSVISGSLRSQANVVSLSQYSPGIEPRDRQELTVEGSTPSAEATVLVRSFPMISSIIEGMGRNIVGKMPTRQGFAELQSPPRAEVGEMLTMPDTTKIIGARLVRTREALGFPEQAEFCRQLGIDKTVYNPFEKGRRRITVDVALALRVRFGVSLDWIYCGDPSHLPAQIYEKLRQAA